MHDAGTGIERHMLAEHDRHDALIEGMMKAQPLERSPERAWVDRIGTSFGHEATWRVACDPRGKIARQEQRAALGLDQGVAVFRVNA